MLLQRLSAIVSGNAAGLSFDPASSLPWERSRRGGIRSFALHWADISSVGFKRPLPAIGLFTLLLISCTVWGQRYSFKSYTQEQGLANLSARSLLQDHNGFLWVGTNNGLFWYDGKSFHPFAAEELESRRIVGLLETNDGSLWIASQTGLYRRVASHAQKIDSGEAIEITGGASVSIGGGSIAPAGDDGVYLATRQGLARVQRTGDHFSFSWLSRTPTDSVGLDAEGRIWSGCGANLCRFEGSHADAVSGSYGLPAEHWSSIITDAEGNLWVRSTQRLFELPRSAKRFIARDSQLLSNGISYGPLYRSPDGQIMVTMNTGLALFEGNQWRLIDSTRGLAGDSVANVLQDREGSMWIGLHGTGLMRWLGYQQWESWTKAEGLSSDEIWALRHDAQGRLWVGTESGLNEMAPVKDGWLVGRAHKELHGMKVRAMASGQHGEMWAGANPGGVYQFDSKGRLIAVYGIHDGLTPDGIWGLLVDAKGRVWAGTTTGLFLGQRAGRSRRVRFKSVPLPLTDANENFYQPMVDSRGWLWVPGSYGLACLRNGQWKRYRVADGLKSNSTYNVHESGDSSIWVGYFEPFGVTQIVFHGSDTELHHYTQANGLHSNKVYFVGSTRQGLVFVGTDSGLDMLRDGDWQHFGRSQGLVWEDTDSNSFLAENDGSVWIGTSRGLAHFRFPAKSSPARPVTPELLSVQFGDADPSWNALMSVAKPARNSFPINYADRAAHFQFTCLSFLYEDDLKFRYRLKGSTDTWTETEGHEAHFLSLAPGPYIFEVQARITGGIWGPSERLAFVVAHPFWETPWFLMIVAACLGMLAWAAWKWRMKRVIRQKIELEREVEARTVELRALNLQLDRAREAAETANHAKSSFLANVSHEIRTPMNGILGMTQLALACESVAEQKEYLSLVKSSADSLLVVINDVLDYAKAEAGKFTLQPAIFELASLVESVLKSFSAPVRAKKLALTCHLDSHIPAFLVGDDTRLRQVLINLVGNAIKFTQKGEVAVSVELLSSASGIARLRFSVRDSGIGIPQDKLASIFSPFEQADTSTTRKFGGTGLGLAICQKIADLMAGKLWVESEPGKGSVFHLEADFLLADEKLDPTTPVSAYPGNGAVQPSRSLNILLAEDNTINQKLAVALLRKLGHAVTVAENGSIAIEALKSSTFDVVLMDIQMPEMDGFAATAWIRSQEKRTGAHIPIIAMTAHAMTGDRERCLASGMDGYIPKPIQLAKLAAVLAAITIPSFK